MNSDIKRDKRSREDEKESDEPEIRKLPMNEMSNKKYDSNEHFLTWQNLKKINRLIFLPLIPV